MSWFDTTGFASFAKTALTTAQKTIDKALEIKEDASAETSTRKDADSFFEAFGLGAKSASQSKCPPLPPPPKNKPVPEPQQANASQHSGYWTDTWGSFFETKAAVPEGPDASNHSSTATTPTSPKRVSKVVDTVSSQPQRASLFPGGVKQGTSGFPESTEDNSSCSVKKTVEEQMTVPSSKTTSPVVDNALVSKTEESSMEEPGESENSLPKDSESSEEPLVTHSAVFGQLVESGLVENTDSVSCDKTVEVASHVSGNSSTDTLCSVDKVEIVDSGHRNESSETMESQSVVAKTELGDHDTSVMKEHHPEYNENTILSSTIEKSFYTPDDSATVNNSELGSNTILGSFVNLENYGSSSPLHEDDGKTQQKPELSQPIVHEGDPEEKVLMNYVDSFHILSTSVLQGECDWASEDGGNHFDAASHDSAAEDHQYSNVDTRSTCSKEDEMEIGDCEIKSSGSGDSPELSHSFVKCSIEEVDDNCHRGQSPLSTTTSERSDATKLESEQNTSGDENETTTSSDIEILSAPNGENGDRNSSPLKHMWIPHTLRIRRSESPSSDGSKESSVPSGQGSQELMREKSMSKNSYTEKRQGCCGRKLKGIDLDRVLQQQDELQNLLEAREKKVIELSKENLKLHESEEKLQFQLQQLQMNQASESWNTSAVMKELTKKISLLEGEAQKAIKEKDHLRKLLNEAQAEVAQRVTFAEVEDTIKEKDQQIKELMIEGEKLSKKELQLANIIKKLRVKEEDNEHTMKSLKERLEENSKEVERLRKSIGAKDEQEKKHIDAIHQLTTTVNKYEKELANAVSSLEDFTEREIGLKKSLESTFKELTDLKTACSGKDKEIQELTLSVEMASKEKLREGLDQASREASREKGALLFQIEDLRSSLKHSEEAANSRENALKEDIARLQLRLQESEARNEELTKSISTATRPLVRQIENYQSSYNSQIASWEKIEKNLSDQLNDSQNQMAVCSERERLANEKYQELSSKYTKLELQTSTIRQEKSQLALELQLLNSKLANFDEKKTRDMASIDSLRQALITEVNGLKNEKEIVHGELQNALELLKEERQTVRVLQEELRIKENKLLSVENASHSPSPNASLTGSVDSVNNWVQDEAQERRLSTPINSSYRISVYDSLRTGCTASILENLQSQLKQREGEIAQLQCEIVKLEREREGLAQELVDITTQNESLQEKLDKLEEIEKLYKDLNQRYNTLLQMYGEKVEECDELKLDLADVKTAYKVQIEELLSAK